MYCQACGFINEKGAVHCRVCQTELSLDRGDLDDAIQADVNQIPIMELLRTLKKELRPMTLILSPVIVLILLGGRIFKRHFFLNSHHSRGCRIHPVDPAALKLPKSKKLDKFKDFLIQNGFTPLIDLEDRSYLAANVISYYVNKKDKIYAHVSIKKDTGRPLIVYFYGYSAKCFVMACNDYVLPIKQPANLKLLGYCDLGIEDTYEKFKEASKEFQHNRQLLKMSSFFKNNQKIRLYTMRQGIRQGIYKAVEQKGPVSEAAGQASGQKNGAPAPASVSTCYFHNTNIAVRNCDGCGLALCDHCYNQWQGKYYCPECLAANKEASGGDQAHAVVAPESAAGEGRTRYGGLIIRTAAFMVDLAVIILVAAGVWFGLNKSLGLLLERMAAPISGLSALLVAAAFSVYYLIIPVSRYGRTIGGLVFGLRVIDDQGRNPDIRASVVRFAYYTVCCLFIFPILGFLTIPFSKMKQGLHDKLSETWVASRRSLVRTLVAWLIVLALPGAAVVGMAGRLSDFAPLLSLFFSIGLEAEINLETVWTYPEKTDSDSYVGWKIEGERCLVGDEGGLRALDLNTGRTLWKNDKLTRTGFLMDETAEDSVVLVEKIQDSGVASLMLLDPENGRVKWSIKHDLYGPDGYGEAYIIHNRQYIFLYNQERIQAHDLEAGKLLWEKAWPADVEVSRVVVNQCLLAESYKDDKTTLSCFSMETGELLWRDDKGFIELGFSLRDGYQVLYKSANEIVMLHLPDREELWRLEMDNPYLVAIDRFTAADAPPVFFTSSGAYNALAGREIYSFPKGFVFVDQSREYLVLNKIDQGEPEKTEDIKSTVFLYDKNNQKTRELLTSPGYIQPAVLKDAENALYLAVTLMEPGNLAGRPALEIWRVDKLTGGLQRTRTGRGLTNRGVRLLDDLKLVFIPEINQVGVYSLIEEQ